MKLQAQSDDHGQRLDQYLVSRLENVTRSQIQLLNRAGAILVNARLEKAGYRLRGSETIDVELTSLDTHTPVAEHIPLHIVFEDKDLAVIEKPAGLVVHPGSGIRSGTVVNALLHHFRNLSDFAGDGRPGIVHRIDKWTSGLLIVARTNAAHAMLGRAFQERQVQKTYVALVHGSPAAPSAVIETAISRHPRIRTRMAAIADGGRSAYSAYRTVEKFREFSLLEVNIKTGRTHQIRVHLSALGHPVVGDGVYGERLDKAFVKKYGALGRYFLHAAHLRFAHPMSGEELEFHSPLPEELQNFLERIR